MTTRNRCLTFLMVMLLHLPVVAQVSTETVAPEEVPASEQEPGADARERGLSALDAGNHFAAATAFREATGKGNAEAMRHLADLAFSGKGVAQSYQHAIYWYCKSALDGNLDSVDRLQTIELGSWSARRNAQGWEPACKEWVKPKPPPQPIPAQTSVGSPDIVIEFRVKQEPPVESFSSWGFWPRYAPRHVPWYWQSVNPQHPRQKRERPRVPSYVPGGISR